MGTEGGSGDGARAVATVRVLGNDVQVYWGCHGEEGQEEAGAQGLKKAFHLFAFDVAVLVLAVVRW